MSTTGRIGLGIQLTAPSTLDLAVADGQLTELPPVPAAVGIRDGALVVGEEALALAAAEPAKVARDFLAELGTSDPKIVGSVPYGVDALVAQLLRFVYDSATATSGGEPSRTAIAHPDGMSTYELDVVEHAVRLAGIGETILVPAAQARDAADGGTVAAGAAIIARGEDDGRATRRIPAVPKSARVALLGLPAAAAGGAMTTSGAAPATGGSTLADFAGQGGQTLGDFAGQGGRTLGDFAGSEGSSLSDFADAPARSMSDFAEQPARSMSDFATKDTARAVADTAQKTTRRIGRVPAAIVTATTVAAVAVGGYLVTRNTSDDTASQVTTETSVTTAPADTEDEPAGAAGDFPFLLAGNGENRPGGGNGGPANQASFGEPIAAVTVNTSVFIADRADGSVRLVVPEGGDTRRGVGEGMIDSYADGFENIHALAVNASGAVLVADDRGVFELASVRDEPYKQISERTDVIGMAPMNNDIAMATDDGTIVLRSVEGEERVIAGEGDTVPTIEGAPAAETRFGRIVTISQARGPGLYIATDDRLFVLESSNVVRLVAGGGDLELEGDGSGAFRTDIAPVAVSSDTNTVEAVFADADGIHRVGNDGWIETLYAAGEGDLDELQPGSVTIDATGPIVIAEPKLRVVRALPRPEDYRPKGPFGRVGTLDTPFYYGATMGTPQPATAAIEMTLPADVTDVVVVVCENGEPTHTQWDTIVRDRDLPAGVTSATTKGEGRMLGIVDRRGRLLNDDTGELPDPVDRSSLDVELVMEYAGASDMAGKALCVSVVRASGAVDTSTVTAPPAGTWYPT